MIEEGFKRSPERNVFFALDSLPHNLHSRSEWFNATVNIPFDQPIVFTSPIVHLKKPQSIANIKTIGLSDDIIYKLRISTPVVISNSYIFWTGSITNMHITLSHDDVNRLNIEAATCNLSYVPTEFYRYNRKD